MGRTIDLLQWWAPWSRQWSSGNRRTEINGLWSVQFYSWRTLPLVMPPSASCNVQYTPVMPTLAPCKATLALGKPLLRSLGLLECHMYCQAASPSVPYLITRTMAVGHLYPCHEQYRYKPSACIAFFNPKFPMSVHHPFLATPLRL